VHKGSGDGILPVGSRSKAPVEGLRVKPPEAGSPFCNKKCTCDVKMEINDNFCLKFITTHNSVSHDINCYALLWMSLQRNWNNNSVTWLLSQWSRVARYAGWGVKYIVTISNEICDKIISYTRISIQTVRVVWSFSCNCHNCCFLAKLLLSSYSVAFKGNINFSSVWWKLCLVLLLSSELMN